MGKTKQDFKVGVHVLDDKRVLQMTSSLGMSGYGIYIALLSYLRASDDYKLCSIELKALACRLRTRVHLLRKVVYEYDLFRIEENPDGTSVFWSDYLAVEISKQERHKEMQRLRAQKRWDNENKVPDNEGDNEPASIKNGCQTPPFPHQNNMPDEGENEGKSMPGEGMPVTTATTNSRDESLLNEEKTQEPPKLPKPVRK